MKNLFLDLYPTNIPFLLQCTKAAGDKVDPTVDNLIIYEEGGADTTFDSGTIAGSPFDPAQMNAKTGLWGKLVPKSAFTAGKFYIALWEMTVDSIATSKVEKYFACNAASFQSACILDTTQANYAPAKAGDAMALTSDYDAAKTAAQVGDSMVASNMVAEPPDISALALEASVQSIGNPMQTGEKVELTSDYDAAKTAAQAGDAMVASNMVDISLLALEQSVQDNKDILLSENYGLAVIFDYIDSMSSDVNTANSSLDSILIGIGHDVLMGIVEDAILDYGPVQTTIVEAGRLFSIVLDIIGICVAETTGSYMVVNGTKIDLADTDFTIVSNYVGAPVYTNINEFQLLNASLITEDMIEKDIQLVLSYRLYPLPT